MKTFFLTLVLMTQVVSPAGPPALGTISGTITFEDGGARPPLKLRFVQTGGPPTTIPAAGWTYPTFVATFSFEIYPEAEYRVTVLDLPAGYIVKSMTYGSTDLLTQPLKMAPDSTRILLNVGPDSSAPGIKVSGRVIAGNAQVPVGTTLILGRGDGSLISSVRSDGSFAFPKVPPGRYYAAFSPGADPFDRMIVVRTTDLSNLEIPLVIPSFKVTGKAVGEAQLRQEDRLGQNEIVVIALTTPAMSGQAQSIQSGYVGPNLTRHLHPVRLEPDGSFQFLDIPPGTYSVLFGHPCRDCDSIGLYPGDPTTHRVVDADLTNLVIPIRFQ